MIEEDDKNQDFAVILRFLTFRDEQQWTMEIMVISECVVGCTRPYHVATEWIESA